MSVDKDQSPSMLLLDFAENGVNWSASDFRNILSKIAAHLTEELLIKALDITSELEQAWDRADMVEILAAYLPANLMPIALNILDGVHGVGKDGGDYDYDRAIALIKLAAYVPEHLMPHVLDLAYQTQDESARILALTGLIQYLPDILPEVVALGRQISDDANRLYILIKILPYLPDLVPEILLAIHDCKDIPECPLYKESAQAVSLVNLTPYLPDHLLPEAAKIALRIIDTKFRLQALTALVIKLPELRSEALSLAQGIENGYERVEAMAKLSVSLPDIDSEVLEIINSIQDDLTRCRSLKNSLQYLPKHCLPAVLKMTREFQSQAYKSWILVALIDHAPQDLLSEICELVNELEDTALQNRMLKLVANRISQSDTKISTTAN
jgi:hypothetical protein